MKKPQGRIITPDGVNPQPHELRTARSFAALGCTVEFKRRSDDPHVQSADAYIDGILYEFKAPKSSKVEKVQDTLRRALHQSENVVFDARRMKLHETKIRSELEKWAPPAPQPEEA